MSVGFYAESLAHSGATIGISDDEVEDTQREARLNGEIPTNYPTILQQVADFSDQPETVDLILVNGGINDVNVRRVIPSLSDDNLLSLIERHCHQHMRTLLERTTAKFKKATVIVTGYYPMISEDSDLLLLEAFLIGLGLNIGNLLLGFGVVVLSEAIRSRIAANCLLFAEQSEIR